MATAAMEAAPGHATAGTPMDHTPHAHITVSGAGDHAGVRRTDWRAEMCAGEMRTGETGACKAMRRHCHAIVERWRAAEDLHG